MHNATKMLTLSCEFFGGFHDFFLWKDKKKKKKKKKKISHVPCGAQKPCRFQFFQSKKNFWAFLASKCQILPHKNSTKP